MPAIESSAAKGARLKGRSPARQHCARLSPGTSRGPAACMPRPTTSWSAPGSPTGRPGPALGPGGRRRHPRRGAAPTARARRAGHPRASVPAGRGLVRGAAGGAAGLGPRTGRGDPGRRLAGPPPSPHSRHLSDPRPGGGSSSVLNSGARRCDRAMNAACASGPSAGGASVRVATGWPTSVKNSSWPAGAHRHSSREGCRRRW